MAPPLLHMRWVDLGFFHWALDPAAVARRLPPGLQLETYRDRAWVGIVPFRMQAVRPNGLPCVPGLSDFLELNCRTYVRDRHGRSGVWFWSLDCDQSLAVLAARTGFGLRYRRAQLAASRPGSNRPVAYHARRPEGRSHFRYRRIGPWYPASDDPLSSFLLERYRLFAWRPRLRRVWTGLVAHAPYRVAAAAVTCDCAAILHSHQLPMPERAPDHAVVAEELTVRASAPGPVA